MVLSYSTKTIQRTSVDFSDTTKSKNGLVWCIRGHAWGVDGDSGVGCKLLMVLDGLFALY